MTLLESSFILFDYQERGEGRESDGAQFRTVFNFLSGDIYKGRGDGWMGDGSLFYIYLNKI